MTFSAHNPFVKSPYQRWIWVIIGLSLLICLVLFKMGILPLIGFCGLLSLVAVTPLLVNRYSWFLFAWLFLVPAFDNLGGGNPVVLAVTGLSFPFSIYLFARDFNEIRKNLPFTFYLALFVLLMFLNIFRPDKASTALSEFMKFYIELFVVYLGYNVVKEGKGKQLANQINVFIMLNSVVAVFQRLTGVGMRLIEGVPRVGGVVGHPNVLGFLNVLYLPFAIYCLTQSQTRREKQWWMVGIVTASVALLLTMCKSVMLALAFDVVMLFLLLPRSVKLKVLFHSTWVLLLAALLNIGLNLHLEGAFLSRIGNSDSWVWRQKIWGWLLSAMNGHNIWLGNGSGSAQVFLQSIDYDEPFLTHNIYIRLLFEYGLSGCIFYLIFLSVLTNFIGPWGQSLRQNILPFLIIVAIFMNMGADNSVFLRTPMNFAWIFLTLFALKAKSCTISDKSKLEPTYKLS